jgi:large subunit ribosomal protein L30
VNDMYVAIKVRSNVKIKHGLGMTMDLLRLNRVNHCVLIPDKQLSMLKKVDAYITYGRIDEKTLALVLEKRGRLAGNKRLTEIVLKEKKLGTFTELAKKLLEEKTTLIQAGIKPVFRLNAPKKGHARAGIKTPFAMGGALGNRKNAINTLILRMM